MFLGVSGLRNSRKNPLVRGQVHAWIGIVLGSLVTIAHVTVVVVLLATRHHG
jgi:hypothetical protein